MFTTILLTVIAVLVVLVLAVLLAAAFRPASFRVARAARIEAPATVIFPFIVDFRRWASWSPYEKRDPAMRRIFGDITSGPGATYGWAGDRNVGEGRMEMTDAEAPSRIQLRLEMIKPFAADNTVEFTLRPDGDATTVTWAMTGAAPLMARVMGLLFNMDRMVGRDFEAGLATLKTQAEREAGSAMRLAG